MSRDPRLYLEDILTRCDKILRHTSGLSQEDFLANDILYEAILRHIGIIGEAVRQIPEDIRSLRPDIPWRKISETRNILIHVYFGIDDDIIWDIIRTKIPELEQGVKEMYSSIEGRET